MKKALILFLFIFIAPLYAKPTHALEVLESLKAYEIEVQLCRVHKDTYVLIMNKADNVQKSVLVYGTGEQTARRAYGEILLKYYKIKNKGIKKEIDGHTYTVPQDNSKELAAFMDALTDIQSLRKYKSFSWIDDNTGKREKVERDEIGSSAGYFAKISAGDYIKYLYEV